MRQLPAVIQMAADKKLARAEDHRAPAGSGAGSPLYAPLTVRRHHDQVASTFFSSSNNRFIGMITYFAERLARDASLLGRLFDI